MTGAANQRRAWPWWRSCATLSWIQTEERSTTLRRRIMFTALQERQTLNNGRAKNVTEVECYKAGNPRDLIGWPVWGS